MLLHKCVNKELYNQLLDKQMSATFSLLIEKLGSASQRGASITCVSTLFNQCSSWECICRKFIAKLCLSQENINLPIIELYKALFFMFYHTFSYLDIFSKM